MPSKVQAINAHGWAAYRRGCRCDICQRAAADVKRKSRANAKQRKQAEASEAEAEAIAYEAALVQRLSDEYDDLCEAEEEQREAQMIPKSWFDLPPDEFARRVRNA